MNTASEEINFIYLKQEAAILTRKVDVNPEEEHEKVYRSYSVGKNQATASKFKSFIETKCKV